MPEEIPLRVYVESLLAAKDKLDTERERLWQERDRRYEEALKAMKEATSAAFSASQKAIDLASAANERSADASNEIRGAMLDQQAKLMPRSEAEAILARNAADIKSVTDRLNVSSGRGIGIKDSYGWLAGLAGGLLAFFALLLAAFEAFER
jgi:hypothetical protein